MKDNELKSIILNIANRNELHHTLGFDNTIIVIRNTDLNTGKYIENTGENAMDGIVLWSKDKFIQLQGRSKINQSYLDKAFRNGKKVTNFNYIAPCYRSNAFCRGSHKDKPALIQNAKLPLIRTIDKHFGNDDDYAEFDIVADNFHGFLASMGCIVVAGHMGLRQPRWNYNQLTGDWKTAYNWIYRSGLRNVFDVLILERSDFENPLRLALRFGSVGEKVKELQNIIGADIDGDFGFKTLTTLMEYQKANNIKDFGVFEI